MKNGIGDRIRRLRESVSPTLSCRELDDLAGITQGHTSLIERTAGMPTKTGKTTSMTAETLSAIAGVFDVTLDWLVLGKGKEPNMPRVRAFVAPSVDALRVPGGRERARSA